MVPESTSSIDLDDHDDDENGTHNRDGENGSMVHNKTAPSLSVQERLHHCCGYDDHGCCCCCCSNRNRNSHGRGKRRKRYTITGMPFCRHDEDGRPQHQHRSRPQLGRYRYQYRYRYMVVGMFMATYVIVTQVWVSTQHQVLLTHRQYVDVVKESTASAATMSMSMVMSMMAGVSSSSSSSSPSPQTTTTTTTKEDSSKYYKGRIFLEGYNQNIHILFPDYLYHKGHDEFDPFEKHRWKNDDDSSSSKKKNHSSNPPPPPPPTSDDILIHGDPLNILSSIEDTKTFPGKILFVNGESHGDMFAMDKTKEPIRSLTRIQYQTGSSSNKNNTKKGNDDDDDDDLRNDITNRIFQIGPFPYNEDIDIGDGDDADDRSTVSTVVSAGVAAAASVMDDDDGSKRDIKFFQELGKRNSQEFFFFTTALGSRMVWEVDSNKYDDYNDEEATTKTPQTTADYGKLLPNTVAWKSLTDPSRRAHNNGKFHAVAFFQTNCKVHRVTAGKKISDIVQIHHGSKCKIQNHRKPNATVLVEQKKADWSKNIELLQDYKYCLVLENKQKPHYLTEKLLNAVLAGCVPIYYGLPNVHDIFNPNSFILYDINNPQPALDMIRKLETNNTLYEEMLSAPLLQPGAVDRYFSIYPTLGDGSMFRRIRRMMGLPPTYV